MGSPERPPGNKEPNKRKRVRAGSKKGVAYLPVVDLTGSKESHQTDGPVDAESLVIFLHEASERNVRRKRGRR